MYSYSMVITYVAIAFITGISIGIVIAELRNMFNDR